MRTYGGVSTVKEDPTRCIEGVSEGGRSVAVYQCQRPRGFGKGKLYCKQHALAFTGGKGETWYHIWFGNRIEEVEVTRTSGDSIWVKYGERSSRTTNKGNYFKTYEEAVETLIAQREEQLAGAKEALAEALQLRKGTENRNASTVK